MLLFAASTTVGAMTRNAGKLGEVEVKVNLPGADPCTRDATSSPVDHIG